MYHALVLLDCEKRYEKKMFYVLFLKMLFCSQKQDIKSLLIILTIVLSYHKVIAVRTYEHFTFEKVKHLLPCQNVINNK